MNNKATDAAHALLAAILIGAFAADAKQRRKQGDAFGKPEPAFDPPAILPDGVELWHQVRVLNYEPDLSCAILRRVWLQNEQPAIMVTLCKPRTPDLDFVLQYDHINKRDTDFFNFTEEHIAQMLGASLNHIDQLMENLPPCTCGTCP